MTNTNMTRNELRTEAKNIKTVKKYFKKHHITDYLVSPEYDHNGESFIWIVWFSYDDGYCSRELVTMLGGIYKDHF